MPEAHTVNQPYPRNTPVGSSSSLEGYSGVGILMFPESTPIPGVASVLARTLSAQWVPTNDGVVVRSKGLDEEAFGDNLTAAKREFLTSLYDRRVSLLGREDKLSGHDRGILQQLNSILKD